MECFSKWKKKINENNYTNEEINERFTQINKPYNSFCLSDYIDYNCIVDTIITRSQPYGEQNNNANIKEDKIIDLVKKTSLNSKNKKNKNLNKISNKLSGTSNVFKNTSSNQNISNNMNQQNYHSDTIFRPLVQTGLNIPTINQNGNEVNLPNYNEMSIDLKIRPSHFLLTEKKKKNETDEMFEKRKFKWHCEYGIPDNLDKLRYEFSLYRNLKNQKIFVWGPPSSGKSTLSEKLSEQLKLPHIKLKDLIDIAKRRKNPLGEEIRKKIKELRAVVLEAEEEYNKRKNKKKTDPPFDPNLYKRFPDELIVKIVKARLMESDCLSKGFILDGYPKKYQDAIDLFTENNAISSLIPDSVLFISNLTDEILKERVASIKEYETDPDTINRRFERRYGDYKALNETEGTKGVLEFFKENNVQIFNYDENLLKENEEEFKEQLKLYLNKDGEINNISRLTDQEQIIPIEIKYNTLAFKELQDQQKRAEEAKRMLEKAEGLTNVTIDDEEYKDVEAVEKNTINRIKELNKKEQKLLEKKSEVLRHYLIENVIPLLSRGILRICKDQPDDPVDALANFLFETCFKKEEAKDEMEENKEDNELVISCNNISNH